MRADGWFRAAPGHPWLDPAVTGDPAHRPAAPAVGVDGKERRLAKAGGKKKVHLLGAITHVTGLVIGQDRVAKAGKASEVTHFKPLLEPWRGRAVRQELDRRTVPFAVLKGIGVCAWCDRDDRCADNKKWHGEGEGSPGSS